MAVNDEGPGDGIAELAVLNDYWIERCPCAAVRCARCEGARYVWTSEADPKRYSDRALYRELQRRAAHEKFALLRRWVKSAIDEHAPALLYMLEEDARSRREDEVCCLTDAQRAKLEGVQEQMALMLKLTEPSTIDLLLEQNPGAFEGVSFDSLSSLEALRGLLIMQ
ncbi:MAG: hypothetical protein ABI624_11045 [Casimicrobiaceae bacterium]